MGEVIDLKTPCNICGVAGGHAVGCNRHPDRMRLLAREREARYASGELERPHRASTKRLRGGRGVVDELTETASQMLYGDRADAVKVLRRQLKSKDEKTAQRAALEILAYTDGKPTQKIEQTGEKITVVEYRSAALEYEGVDEPPAHLAIVDAS